MLHAPMLKLERMSASTVCGCAEYLQSWRQENHIVHNAYATDTLILLGS